MYKGKKILITGGTGTIGQHLTRRLLQEDPAVIRIFSRDEYKQFQMSIDFQEHVHKLRYLIGDVRDQERLIRAMEDIDYVFHLAAMKHVPACEYNPFEAVQTNVIGTQNVIQAALHNNVKKVLFTSSDKAVSPINTYGATKLMAERLISAASFQKGPKATIFASVRFGNVMGSRGSVIPLFKKQIMEQRKVTVTDLNMTRYMMTPMQAISLMLEANCLSRGGEVFVLKMPIVKLSDLVNVLIETYQAKGDIGRPIQILETGPRPGEKFDEELMTSEEMKHALDTSYMYIIPPIYGLNQNAEYHHSVQLSNDEHYVPNETISTEKLRRWLEKEGILE